MNTDVPGSPESCRATADALRLLGRQLEHADRLASRGARTPETQFDGLSADSYRAACAALAASAATHAASAQRSAGALASYADDLAAVQRVMERVRRSAAVHGLLSGTELVPAAAPTPHQSDVLERLTAIAADALAHLERARDRLGAAFPGQPFPADYGNVLLPPVDEPSGPLPFPPPEAAWPPEARDDDPRPAYPRRDGERAGPDHPTGPDGSSEAPEGSRDAPEGTREAPDGSPDPEGADGGGGGPRREVPPDPPLRFHCGGPVGGGDLGVGEWREEPPGHVLRPVPEPVP